jgi:hypothetical protein
MAAGFSNRPHAFRADSGLATHGQSAFSVREPQGSRAHFRSRASWPSPRSRYHPHVLLTEDITLTGPDALLMASRLAQLGVELTSIV